MGRRLSPTADRSHQRNRTGAMIDFTKFLIREDRANHIAWTVLLASLASTGTLLASLLLGLWLWLAPVAALTTGAVFNGIKDWVIDAEPDKDDFANGMIGAALVALVAAAPWVASLVR
jgi:hypothetical protein